MEYLFFGLFGFFIPVVFAYITRFRFPCATTGYGLNFIWNWEWNWDIDYKLQLHVHNRIRNMSVESYWSWFEKCNVHVVLVFKPTGSWSWLKMCKMLTLFCSLSLWSLIGDISRSVAWCSYSFGSYAHMDLHWGWEKQQYYQEGSIMKQEKGNIIMRCSLMYL